MEDLLEQRSSGDVSRAPSAAAAARAKLASKLAYGMGSIAFGVKDNGFQVLLLLFYNQALGLDVGLTGLAITLALVFDAMIDPLIGFLSDRTRSRLGRRHPFMYASIVPIGISYIFLFSPPAVTGTALFLYLALLSVAVRAFIASYEIPSSALITDLARGYDERTSYLSYRYFFGWIGGLTMSILAFSVFLKPMPGSARLNPAGYSHYGLTAALIMMAAILLSSLATQRETTRAERVLQRGRAAIGGRGVIATIASVSRSRSAVTSILSGMFMLLATTMSFALLTYFELFYWELSTAQISIFISGNFISATAALFIAPRLARRFEKKGAAIRVGIVLIVLLPLPFGLRALDWFPANGSAALLPLLFVHNVAATALSILLPILAASMIADVVEEHEVDTGFRDEGMFFALSTFMQKCATGFGVFVSSGLLFLSGFPKQAVAGHVALSTLHSLAAGYSMALLLLYAAGIASAAFYPISRARHAAHVETLERRRRNGYAATRPHAMTIDPELVF